MWYFSHACIDHLSTIEYTPFILKENIVLHAIPMVLASWHGRWHSLKTWLRWWLWWRPGTARNRPETRECDDFVHTPHIAGRCLVLACFSLTRAVCRHQSTRIPWSRSLVDLLPSKRTFLRTIVRRKIRRTWRRKACVLTSLRWCKVWSLDLRIGRPSTALKSPLLWTLQCFLVVVAGSGYRCRQSLLFVK